MNPRGRRLGQLANPRDANGWMIPRPGTIRRAVYDALRNGISSIEACGELNLTRRAFKSHKAYIVRWQKVHVWRKAAENRECRA